MALYKAIIKNRQTKETSIIESEYNSKIEFINDLRKNGYMVNPLKVKKADVFDYIMNNTNCNEWNWKENK
jgi:hypothetical protein